MQNQKTELNYIKILIDSLKDKKECLEKLIETNRQFEKIASEDELNQDAFDENMGKKIKYIKCLDELDDGFTMVYNRVKEVLDGNRDTYKEEIGMLKELIKDITDLTVKLQVLEQSNRELFEKRMGSSAGKIKIARTSNKAATSYYKNMTSFSVLEPQFVDKKK